MPKFFEIDFNNTKQVVLVFALSLLIILIQLSMMGMHIPYADNVTYLALALPLYETGIFEDGNFKNSVLPPAEGGEGMFFAPLYAAFLSGLLFLSESFLETARCSVEFIRPVDIKQNCNLDFTVMWVAQSALGAIAAVFVWLTANGLFQNKKISWIAWSLIITLNNFSAYAHIVMLEALIQPLFYAVTYFLVLAVKEKQKSYSFAFGVLSGLLILTKDSFMYQTCFLIILGFFSALFQYRSKFIKKTLTLVILASLGVVLVVGPWIYRNYSKFGIPAVTYGYGAFTLVQRVAYNSMSVKEWWVGWVYGIPGEGDAISQLFFEKEVYERWEFDNPVGFYQVGNGQLRYDTLEAAGSHNDHLSYLIKHYVFDDIIWHTFVTLPIVFRGMWVFENWVFIPYLAFLYMCYIGFKRHKYLYIIYALPPWFMLGLHAFASVNIARYNIILQGSLAIGFAYCIYHYFGNTRLGQLLVAYYNRLIAQIRL